MTAPSWRVPGSRRRTWLVGAWAGGLMALGLSPWVLALHALAPSVLGMAALWGVVREADLMNPPGSPRRVGRTALMGWVFGSVWLVGATGWLYVSLHRYGGLPGWMAGSAVVFLCGALSAYMALAWGLWARWRTGRVGSDSLLGAALFTLAEAARALIFTGFPWGAFGYLHTDSPWALLAPWVGVYGVGMVCAGAVMAAALSVSRLQRGWAASCWGVVLPLGALWLLLSTVAPPGHFVSPQGGVLSVSLLQGNVPQDEKFAQALQARMVAWHAEQLLASTDDLVVAPETAIPLLPSDLPEGFFEGLLQAFQASQRSALFGMPLGSYAEGYSNSVVGVSQRTAQQSPNGFYRYNKHHLVPFGEFIPGGFRWFVRLMNMPLGDFTRGPLHAPSFPVRDQWVAPNICYEDLFGEELAARFVQPGQAVPTVLANVSNLAWFGETVAIGQHLQIARMRSLEFQRPTLRSTNTGATVVIDHLGRVTHEMAPNTQGVLRAQVQGTRGLTPYAQWAGRWGLWPLVGWCLLSVLGLVWWRPAA